MTAPCIYANLTVTPPSPVHVAQSEIQETQQSEARQSTPPGPQALPRPTGLNDVLLSEDDQAYISDFHQALASLEQEVCTVCKEEWFELGVRDGVCRRCKRDSNRRFTAANHMDPGEHCMP